MGLRKILNDCFDPLEAVDDNQERYRQAFGIVDRYLLNYQLEEDKTGFIVYIDRDYDIDWVDNNYVSQWPLEEKAIFYDIIGKLDSAQTFPIEILSKKKLLNFKRILGTGYVNAFNKQFDGIDKVIEQAQTYASNRCQEKARTIFLTVATICILSFSVLFFLQKFNIISLPWSLNFSAAIVFGTAGAYTSIWSRFKNLTMKGISTKFALVMESLSRLFIGCISATVIIMAFKIDFILTVIQDKDPLYTYSIIAFVAGFSERWLTSIVERFINQNKIENE